MNLDFSKLAYICLFCFDIDESLRFYRDILRLKVIHKSEDFISFDTGDIQLAIEPNGYRKEEQKQHNENPYLLQIKVESEAKLEKMNNYLISKGVKLLYKSTKTDYGILTSFLDPDGNQLELICEEFQTEL